jgi:ribosome-associated protein
MTKATRRSIAQEELPNAIVPPPIEQYEHSLKLAKASARTAAENKGQDIVVLDVSKQTAIFDFFVIATGTSRRQLHAISDEIDRAFEAFDERRVSTSGYDESRWIVLDYGGVLVHLFDEETRAFYDLEGLWADSPRIDLTDALKNTGAAVIRTEGN